MSTNTTNPFPTSTSGTDPEFIPSMGNNGCVPINYNEIYNLIGKLLTLIDATFTDKDQREAYKDVVKATVKGWIERTYKYTPSIDWTYYYASEEHPKGRFEVRDVYVPGHDFNSGLAGSPVHEVI